MSHSIRSSAKVSFYIVLCTQLRKASPEQAAEELANITSMEIQADDVCDRCALDSYTDNMNTHASTHLSHVATCKKKQRGQFHNASTLLPYVHTLFK